MVHIEERLPTVAEYVALRTAVGWRVPDHGACQRALAGSQVAAVAVDDGRVVGLGRLVGDGAFYRFVVDLMVDPSQHHHGIGRSIVAALETAAARHDAVGAVSLVADQDMVPFYELQGYEASAGTFMTKPVARPST
jgi:GNAT superfamily N-acetyltransferase